MEILELAHGTHGLFDEPLRNGTKQMLRSQRSGYINTLGPRRAIKWYLGCLGTTVPRARRGSHALLGVYEWYFIGILAFV